MQETKQDPIMKQIQKQKTIQKQFIEQTPIQEQVIIQKYFYPTVQSQANIHEIKIPSGFSLPPSQPFYFSRQLPKIHPRRKYRYTASLEAVYRGLTSKEKTKATIGSLFTGVEF